MPSSYSLTQLRSFVVLAEELHFGNAAEKLQMTQPPLTRQIQKLESGLNFQLFERNNRHVRLTPAGDAFYQEARRVLAMADLAPARAAMIASGQAGSLAVSFTATSAHSALAPLLDLFESLIPNVELSLAELVSEDQVEAVLAGEVDIGLVREPSTSKDLIGYLIHQEPLILAMPINHPLAGDELYISVKQLEGESLINYSHIGSEYFANLVKEIFAGVRTKASLTVRQIHTALTLVSAQRGIALAPKSAERFAFDNVTFRGIAEFQEPVIELYAIWRRDSTNPALRRVAGAISSMTPFDT